MKILIGLTLLVLVSGLILSGCQASRSGYDTAAYRVVAGGENDIEIREYPALVLAETGMAGGRDGMNGGFRRLFRYISGGNAESNKIAMTTPVFVTGPDAGTSMSFVMPADRAADRLPRPGDEAVQITSFPAGRYAVLRYNGRLSEENRREAAVRLAAWLKAKGLTGKGDMVQAYYDPPWTLPPFRRNEIMIRLDGGAQLTPGA